MDNSCRHQTIAHRNCTHCGVYIFKEVGVQGLKLETYTQTGNSISHLRALRRNNIKFKKQTVKFCNKVQVKLLFNVLMSKLGYSKETLALALYYFENIMGEQDLDNGLHNLQKKQIIFAATCISLAAKSIEPECKHVKMSALRNILQSDLANKDFARAEMQIFNHFNYELNALTFLDFLNYYLMKGGLFSNQPFKDINKFEARVNEMAWEYIKNGQFIQKDQQSLAAYILYRCRKQFKVNEVWNWHIQYYTKLDTGNLRCIIAQMEITALQPNLCLYLNKPPIANKLEFLNQSPKKRKQISIQNIQQSINNIKKGFSKLRTSRSGSECKMQSVRSSSSVRKFTFRIQ